MAIFRPRRIKHTRWVMRHKRSSSLKLQQLLQKKFLVLIISIIAVGILLSLVFFTTLLHVKSVLVTTDHKDINVELVIKALEKEVLGRNTLNISLGSLVKNLLKAFPEISKLDCTRIFLQQSLECEALGFPLIAVFKHEGKKYYMNENGVVVAYDSRKLGLLTFDLILNPIFAEKPQSETSNQQPGASNQRPVFTVAVGKKILQPEEIQRILQAIQRLETLLTTRVIQAQYIQVAAELSLTLKVERELTILLDLSNDLETQIKKLERFSQAFDLKTISRIDLSIEGEKIFYK